MNKPLGVSPSKGKQGTTRGKEKILLKMTLICMKMKLHAELIFI